MLSLKEYFAEESFMAKIEDAVVSGFISNIYY